MDEVSLEVPSSPVPEHATLSAASAAAAQRRCLRQPRGARGGCARRWVGIIRAEGTNWSPDHECGFESTAVTCGDARRTSNDFPSLLFDLFPPFHDAHSGSFPRITCCGETARPPPYEYIFKSSYRAKLSAIRHTKGGERLRTRDRLSRAYSLSSVQLRSPHTHLNMRTVTPRVGSIIL